QRDEDPEPPVAEADEGDEGAVQARGKADASSPAHPEPVPELDAAEFFLRSGRGLGTALPATRHGASRIASIRSPVASQVSSRKIRARAATPSERPRSGRRRRSTSAASSSSGFAGSTRSPVSPS